MNETAVRPARVGAEDKEASVSALPLEKPNDSGVQREGSGGSVPKLCPKNGDESGAAAPSGKERTGPAAQDSLTADRAAIGDAVRMHHRLANRE